MVTQSGWGSTRGFQVQGQPEQFGKTLAQNKILKKGWGNVALSGRVLASICKALGSITSTEGGKKESGNSNKRVKKE